MSEIYFTKQPTENVPSSGHLPYRSNLAASSYDQPIDFRVCGTTLCILNGTSNADHILAKVNLHSQINYIRIASFMGKEVLGAVTDSGEVFWWNTCELLRKAAKKEPISAVHKFSVVESAWGIAFHNRLPLVAVSHNGGRIELYNPDTGCRVVSPELPGNIPFVEFFETESKSSVKIAYNTVHRSLDSGSFGVWGVHYQSTNDPAYAGQLVYQVSTPEPCWTGLVLYESQFAPVLDKDNLCWHPEHILEAAPLPEYTGNKAERELHILENGARSCQVHTGRPLLVVTMRTQIKVVDAVSGDVYFAVQYPEYETSTVDAINMVHFIEPLSLLFTASRSGRFVFHRLTRSGTGAVGLRFEAMETYSAQSIWVGFSVRQMRCDVVRVDHGREYPDAVKVFLLKVYDVCAKYASLLYESTPRNELL